MQQVNTSNDFLLLSSDTAVLLTDNGGLILPFLTPALTN